MANEMQEFHKAYEYCFFRVRLKASKQNRAFLLTGVVYDAKHVVGKIVSAQLKEKANTYDYEEFRAEAEPLIPTAGYLNCTLDRPTALFLSLSPDRQYRKALYHESTGLYPVPTGSQEHKDYVGRQHDGGLDYYLKAYANQLAITPYPIYYPILGALDQVETGDAHSYAISRFFAIGLAKGFKFPCLWHKNSREGFFVDRKLYVSDKILPFRDFFYKKWQFPIYPLVEAKV